MKDKKKVIASILDSVENQLRLHQIKLQRARKNQLVKEIRSGSRVAGKPGVKIKTEINI